MHTTVRRPCRVELLIYLLGRVTLRVRLRLPTCPQHLRRLIASNTDMMEKILAVVAALAVGQVSAQGDMLRFGCSQLVIERADPIVNPGMTPSAHTHQIVGGNSFNFSVRTPGRNGRASAQMVGC